MLFIDLEISAIQDVGKGAVVSKAILANLKDLSLHGSVQGDRKRVH